MTPQDREEATAILAELQRIENELESLLAEGSPEAHRRTSTVTLQARLKSIKDEIKLAGKRETVSRKKQPPSELERCFFGPALSHASAAFRIPANAKPFTHQWWSGISDVQFEIVYYRDRLEHFLKQALDS